VELPEAPVELADFLEDDIEVSPPVTKVRKKSAGNLTCPMCGARHARTDRRCKSCGESLDDRETATGRDNVWRDGKLLVMRKTAELPDRCVKTNAPAESWLKRSLSWHPPLIYLTALAGLLLYVIVALIVRHTATIYVGLSRAAVRRRWTAILLGWLLALAFFGLFCMGIAFLSPQNRQWEHLALWCIFGGMLGGLITVAVCNHIASCVSPAKITERYVWLKGGHRDYLAELPEWNGDE